MAYREGGYVPHETDVVGGTESAEHNEFPAGHTSTVVEGEPFSADSDRTDILEPTPELTKDEANWTCSCHI